MNNLKKFSALCKGMSNYKKAVLIVVMVLIIGIIGCGQDVKPTDDIMKSIIKEKVCGQLINNPAISDLKFETFNITNGFFSRKPGVAEKVGLIVLR